MTDLNEAFRKVLREEIEAILDARETARMAEPELITLAEARDLMRISKSTLYQIRLNKATNGFPEVNLSERKTVVDKRRLMRWMESRKAVTDISGHSRRRGSINRI